MKALPHLLLSLPACTFLLLSCGAPASPARQLLSVTIAPASADAKDNPNGQVQFVATGHYNTAPYTVTPLSADWGISQFPAQLGTVTQNGLAACNKGASGTSMVEAWVTLAEGPVCETIDSAGRPGCGNVGAAVQLTCP